MMRLFHFSRILAFAAGLSLSLTGCGSSLASWIVATRDHQGDLSLESRHFKDSALAYRLALQIDPHDARAQTGLVESQADLAETYYNDSQFDDALTALDVALKVDPQSVRIAGLRADIESARLKRQIVLSNYPAYAPMASAIGKSYGGLRAQDNEIIYLIKRFGYTYDTADLTNAIRSSVDLTADVGKLTTRLTQLRTLVSAGAIAPESNAPVGGNGASLLPLP